MQDPDSETCSSTAHNYSEYDAADEKCNEEISCISVSDIETIIPPPPVLEDVDTMNFVISRNKQLVSSRIKRINQFLTENPNYLKNFSPKKLYIAFELSNYDIEEMKENLISESFIENLNNEIYRRISITKINKEQAKLNLSELQITSLEEKNGWSESDIRYFLTLISQYENPDFIDWTSISEYFSNQTEKSCQALYANLIEQKIIRQKK